MDLIKYFNVIIQKRTKRLWSKLSKSHFKHLLKLR